MSRKLSRWQALILGLVVLIGLGMAVVGLFAVGSRGWFGANALHVRAGFAEIRGVEIGTRVRIQGIDAGEVVAITPPDGPDSPVIVRLRIKSDYRHLIRNSSMVAIVSEGMIGGKVVEIKPPVRLVGKPMPDLEAAVEDTLLPTETPTDIADVVVEVREAVKGLAGVKGKFDEFGSEAVKMLRKSSEAVDRSKETMASIQRGTDAIGKLPIIRSYVEDATAILVRSGSERNRKVFEESELFEPGRSSLTFSGKEKLREVAKWANALKHKGSEVVIVSYADPTKADPRLARTICKDQTEAVAKYLKDEHKVHKTGGWYNPISSRKVITLGMGLEKPPEVEKEKLPPARIEVIVFVPQS